MPAASAPRRPDSILSTLLLVPKTVRKDKGHRLSQAEAFWSVESEPRPEGFFSGFIMVAFSTPISLTSL